MHRAINGILALLEYVDPRRQSLLPPLAAFGGLDPLQSILELGELASSCRLHTQRPLLCLRNLALTLFSADSLSNSSCLWLPSGADRVQDKCRLHRGDEESSECNKEKERELPRSCPGKSSEISGMKMITAGCTQRTTLSLGPDSGEWRERGRTY